MSSTSLQQMPSTSLQQISTSIVHRISTSAAPHTSLPHTHALRTTLHTTSLHPTSTMSFTSVVMNSTLNLTGLSDSLDVETQTSLGQYLVPKTRDLVAVSLALLVLTLILISVLQGLHFLSKKLHAFLCHARAETAPASQEEISSLMDDGLIKNRVTATWSETPEKWSIQRKPASDLTRREMESPSLAPQALPSSMFAVLAIVCIASLVAAFRQCTRRGQEIMLICLLGIWVLIKVRYALIVNANMGTRLTEDGDILVPGQKPPSFQQKLWRHYYIYDQAPGLFVRSIGWFAMGACIVLALLYEPENGISVAEFEWNSVSILSCHSIECCLAADAVDWDMTRIPSDQCKPKLTLPAWLPKAMQGPEHCSISSIEVFRAYCRSGSCHSEEKAQNLLCRAKQWKYLILEKWLLTVAAVIFLTRFKRLICFLCVRLPERPTNWKNDPEYLSRIGAVIPCHMSAAEIEIPVRSILRHLPAKNIVVVDNANKQSPPDNTRDVVERIDANIQYVYVPVGLKTLAIWTGMQSLPPSVEYIMHVDDDTMLPDDMVFDETAFKEDPNVSEIAYAIRTREGNLLQDAIGMCFKLNATAGVFNNATSGTVLWAAGIIGLVRRSVFQTVLRDHLFLPFGEDCYHGFLQLMNGYKIVREARSTVVTFAPPVFSTVCGASSREQGYGAATLWKQRALRWMVTRLRRGPWMLLLLFTYNGGSLWCNVWFRLNEFDKFARNIMAIVAPLPLLRFITDIIYENDAYYACTCFGLCLLASVLWGIFQYTIINYVCWSHRPDYQVKFTTVLYMPILRFYLHLCQVTGHILCILYWMPFVPTRVWVFTHGQDYGLRPEKSHDGG